MNQNEVIINNILDLFIETNEGSISEEGIDTYCDKYKQILNQMDHVYRCMRL